VGFIEGRDARETVKPFDKITSFHANVRPVSAFNVTDTSFFTNFLHQLLMQSALGGSLQYVFQKRHSNLFADLVS
jgi:hypothetical protein